MTSPWTPDTIRALGATTDLPTLGAIFGFSQWHSYKMLHTGEWEQAGIRIIRIGARYRVTVQSILDVLTLGGAPGTSGSNGQTEAGPGQPPGTGDRASCQGSGPAGRRGQ